MNDSFRLMSPDDLCTILDAVSDLPQDGKWIVTISDKKERRSVRQLRTYWLLINTIVKSGMGGRHESTTEHLDLKLKFSYAFPMLVADDSRVAESWLLWHTNNPSSKDAEWWVRQNIHIGNLSVKQMAILLEDIYHEYGSNIELPDPSMYKYELKH